MFVDPLKSFDNYMSAKNNRMWKIISAISISILLIMNSDHKLKEDYVAKIHIEGEINDKNFETDEVFAKLKNDKNIKALIVKINSPGGSAVLSESIYNKLNKIRKTMPVVAVQDSMAASGGYMISLASDRIFTQGATLTGSIGVLFMNFEATEALEKLGIKPKFYKSSEIKASPNPFEKTSEKAEAVTKETLNQVYDRFVDLVASSRGLEKEYVQKIADGRIYLGQKAVELKLADELGDEEDALIWLQNNKQIDKALKVSRIDEKEKNLLEKILEDTKTSLIKVYTNLFNTNALYY
jgi:protease-4